ncbi:MAG: thymidine phosphorylase [Nitriliruptorales bacterium]|nr:thymidine phosphorylase [Nitriliruptorales bacterium]
MTGPAPLDPPALIAQKRDGGELSRDQLGRFVRGYLDGAVAEEQMAAFLMAGILRGFSDAEAVALTEIYVASGDTVDLAGLTGPTVDKHSTGGVGDTTTLVVAPLLAACGRQVAKLSGRGLGHTGGTLDKLEAIPGFGVDLTPDQLRTQVEDVGVAVAAATADLVPADKRIYALRDVTATVPSPALIAASVMSKKIAGGADTVVLDVKTGGGAFMEDEGEAVSLAELCVHIGVAHGRATAALVTDMSQPLGRAVGNGLEVAEAVAVLRNEQHGRLRDCCLALASAALELTGEADAEGAAERALDGGEALERFRRFVEAQGGDGAVADEPAAVLARAPVVRRWSPGSGIVTAMDCRTIGDVARGLGAGRSRKEDSVDPAVGLVVNASIGDTVGSGDEVVEIHARSDDDADRAVTRLAEAVVLDDGETDAPALVRARVGFDGDTSEGSGT